MLVVEPVAAPIVVTIAGMAYFLLHRTPFDSFLRVLRTLCLIDLVYLSIPLAFGFSNYINSEFGSEVSLYFTLPLFVLYTPLFFFVFFYHPSIILLGMDENVETHGVLITTVGWVADLFVSSCIIWIFLRFTRGWLPIRAVISLLAGLFFLMLSGSLINLGSAIHYICKGISLVFFVLALVIVLKRRSLKKTSSSIGSA